MSFDRYLAGNRVYRSGSSAPTMGTVDPTGYVDRELRKRRMLAGYGDPSQTRSGLAQAALTRLRSGTQQPGMFGAGGSGGQINTFQPPATPSFGPGGNPTPGGNGTDPALAAKLAATKAQHLAEMQQQKHALALKQSTRPQVSSTGKISPAKSKPQAPAPTALPWDIEAMQAKTEAGNHLGEILNQIMQQRQDTQKQFSGGQHQLDIQSVLDRRGLLNNFAGKGLAFSSGYGMGVGNLENDVAQQKSSLADALKQAMTGSYTQESAANADYNHQLATIQQALARRLAQRAGTLGFYQPPTKKATLKKVKK